MGLNARLLVLLLPLALGACTLMPPEHRPTEPAPEPEPAEAPEPDAPEPEVDEPEVDEPPEEAAEPEPEREPAIPDAVIELVADAREASQNGDYDQAAAYLERAVRISPDLAPLWQNLAVVRFQQGDYGQAEQMARRSIRLADGDRALQRRNWQLIEASRAEQGDEEGAHEARRQAEGI